MQNKDPSSTNIIDLKIGTSTVTDNCSRDHEKLAKRIKKDKETTSVELGYKITGYSLRNPNQPPEDFVKKPYKTKEETSDILKKFFGANSKHLMKCYLFVGDLFDFIKNHPYELKGASILIILHGNECEIKLIDLASVNKIYDASKRDEGFLLGLQNLRYSLLNIFKANENI